MYTAKKDIKNAFRGIAAIIHLLVNFLVWLYYPAILFLICIAIHFFTPGSSHDLGRAIAYATASILLMMWDIMHRIKDIADKPNKIKIKLPKGYLGNTYDEGADKLNEDKSEKHLPGLPNATTRLMNSWMRWSRRTFTRSTVVSCFTHLKTEIDELEQAIELRDESEILEEGVDVILTTLSVLGRLGITASQIHEGMRGKFDINVVRKWKLNPNCTYSHIKEPEPVTAERILKLYAYYFTHIGKTFCPAELADEILKITRGSLMLDADLVTQIELWLTDRTYRDMAEEHEEKNYRGQVCVERIQKLFQFMAIGMELAPGTDWKNYDTTELCKALVNMWGAAPATDEELKGSISAYFEPAIQEGSKVELIGNPSMQGTVTLIQDGIADVAWINEPGSFYSLDKFKLIDHFTVEVKQ